MDKSTFNLKEFFTALVTIGTVPMSVVMYSDLSVAIMMIIPCALPGAFFIAFKLAGDEKEIELSLLDLLLFPFAYIVGAFIAPVVLAITVIFAGAHCLNEVKIIHR